MCRCGNSTMRKCGDVVDPHCQDVEMLWIHIFSVTIRINFEFVILVLQSSWWGRESWLLCLICLPGVSWWLSRSSSRCHGLSAVCDCGISWSYSLTIFYLRINVNLHYADPQYICLHSHLKCGNPHCSTIHPHCSTLHPHSKCRDVVDPHCIHILRVKVYIASTSQAIWTLSSTSNH